jgi:hypothetical protein
MDDNNQFNTSALDDTTAFQSFLDSAPSGVKFVPEKYGEINEPTIKSDFGDFSKWLHTTRPEIKIDVDRSVKKLILRNNDIWLPLAYLATDITLPIYLNIVSNYLYDRIKGVLTGDKSRVHLEAVYKDKNDGVTKIFSFDGDGETLKSVIKKFDLNSFME